MPFAVEQFLGIFEDYNLAVWPVQIVLVVLGGAAVGLSLRKSRPGDKIILAILSFLWLWIGVVYHWAYFSSINKAAYLFGALFVLQALIFLYSGVLKSGVSFHFKPNACALVGGIFILYALVVYPILGSLFGHGYPRNPTFGLPCPTTIFTFGLLLMTDKFIPKRVLWIPLAWAVIGSGAALSLSIQEDFGLLVSGLLGTALILFRNRKLESQRITSQLLSGAGA